MPCLSEAQSTSDSLLQDKKLQCLSLMGEVERSDIVPFRLFDVGCHLLTTSH